MGSKRENVLVELPHCSSRASLILLCKHLARQELQEWLTFRENFLEKNKPLKCYYCGKSGLVTDIDDMSSARKRSMLATIDHIVPISKGGEKYDTNNCVVACYPCNAKKKNNLWM